MTLTYRFDVISKENLSEYAVFWPFVMSFIIIFCIQGKLSIRITNERKYVQEKKTHY